MEQLFEFDENHNPIPKPQALAIKEFEKIYSQKNKENAFKELSAVWYIASSSLNNPYKAANLDTIEEYYKAVGEDIFDNPKWIPSTILLKAIDKFKNLSYNENQDELDALMVAKKNLKIFFKEFDPKTGEALEFQKYIDSIGKLDKLIIDIQKRITSGNVESEDTFGGGEKGDFED